MATAFVSGERRPRGGAWTLADLERVLDDGQHCEIIDGSLIMSPAATPLHGVVVRNLYDMLRAAERDDLMVLPGGPAVHVAGTEEHAEHDPVPDLLVLRRGPLPARAFSPADIVLVVEVVSPSSVHRDWWTKRGLYAAVGIPHYWVVECEPQPAVTLFRLVQGAYVEADRVVGADELRAEEPITVSLQPDALTLDGPSLRGPDDS